MTDLLDKETMVALDEIQTTLTVDSVEYKVSTMPSNCFSCYSSCEGGAKVVAMMLVWGTARAVA